MDKWQVNVAGLEVLDVIYLLEHQANKKPITNLEHVEVKMGPKR